MKIIGLTGISGSGASAVAAILKERGGFIVNADELAHEAIAKGKTAFRQIVEAFGEGILTPKGEIDRKALGALVFGAGDKMALLEEIIHPQVEADTQLLINKAKETKKYPFAVIDAPLLIESGMNAMCGVTVLVTASDTIRAERIMARDGLTPQAAARRLASRAGDEALVPHADAVIRNDGSPDELRKKVCETFKGII
jgi:dephospho-CoA kinase